MAFNKSLLLTAGLLVSTTVLSNSASARWQKEEDAAAHYESVVASMKVNADYSVEITEEYSAVIDKQAAVDDFAIIKLPYTPSTESVKVLSAEAIVGGKIFKIDPKQIEDKEATQQAQGYDSSHEVRFSLPQVGVGTKIHFKVWIKKQPNLLPRFVAETYEFFDRYPVKNVRFDLDSAIPISYRLYDSRHQMKAMETPQKRGLRLQFVSNSSIFQNVIGEPLSAFNEPQAPVLFISNGGTWPEFGNQIAQAYEKIVQNPLPPEFSAIANEAKTKTDPMDQVESVLEQLHKLIHYVGNWKTVKGQYFPRPLSEIATTRFGDCKDYTIAATAIFRSLGFEASPAWTNVDTIGKLDLSALGIESGGKPPRLTGFQPALPGLFFNHAIVKLKLKDHDYWIDPTSPINYARGALPELAGKYALTLKSGGAKLETIPFGETSENEVSSTTFIALNQDRTADEITRVRMRGYSAALVSMSEADGKIQLSQLEKVLNDTDAIASKKNSSSYKSGVLAFDKGENGMELGSDTSAGAGVKFKFPVALYPFVSDQSQTVGNLVFATPVKTLTTTYIQGGSLLGEFPSSCTVETPWFVASRQFTKESEAIKVVEETEVKTAWIENSVLQGKELKDAKDKLSECWKDTTLVFQPQSFKNSREESDPLKPWTLTSWQIKKLKAKKVASNSYAYAMKAIGRDASAGKTFPLVQINPEWTKGKTPEDLKEKAIELMDNYQGDLLLPLTAKFLLREALHSSPTDPEIFALLALSEDSLAMINSGEYDPKGEKRGRSYAYYGLSLDPLSPLANRALARLLSDQPKGSVNDAVAEANFAMKLDPKSSRAKRTLARVLLHADKAEEALEVAKGTDDHFLLARIYVQLNRYDEAEAEHKAEINEKPTAWNYVNFASFYLWRENPDQAIGMAKKALEVREFGMAHSILSKAYTLKARQLERISAGPEEALSYLHKALEEDNSNSDAHFVLGWRLAQMALKSPDDHLKASAIEQLEIVLRINPENTEAPKMIERLKKGPSLASYMPALMVAGTPSGLIFPVKDFEAQKKLADDELKKGAVFRQYDDSLAPVIGLSTRPIFGICGVRRGGPSHFDFFIHLKDDGKIESLYYSPEDPTTACIASAIAKKMSLPKPPAGPFVKHFALNFHN